MAGSGNTRIILVEANEKIGLDMHPKLSAYVTKHLKCIGIDVRLNSRVTRISKKGWKSRHWKLCSQYSYLGGWCCCKSLNCTLPVERDNIGRVLIDDYMALPGVPGVYAVGDCAHFADIKSGQTAPPRAHIAVRQAKAVAQNVLAEIRGRGRRKYRYSNAAEAVSLGSTNAAVRFYWLRVYGFRQVLCG